MDSDQPPEITSELVENIKRPLQERSRLPKPLPAQATAQVRSSLAETTHQSGTLLRKTFKLNSNGMIKKGQTEFSAAEKQAILDKLDKGVYRTTKQAAEENNISDRTLRRWKQQRESIRMIATKKPNAKRLRSSMHERVESIAITSNEIDGVSVPKWSEVQSALTVLSRATACLEEAERVNCQAAIDNIDDLLRPRRTARLQDSSITAFFKPVARR
eukprot:m.293421 g.293421  ORF g.293421 m.293421 type:complete len:216 (-) comp22351_c0_seq1:162-809(-)